jgi:hypothetical protein
MPLVIQPSIKDVTREELEAHIEDVRLRRMLAAVQLQETRNQKLAAISGKLRRQIAGQCEMLEKEIIRLDNALERVEQRAHRIEMLKSDAQQNAEMIEMIDPNNVGGEGYED